MTDGNIEFSVELDAKDAERELSQLKKEINRLEDDTSVKNAAKERLTAQLKEIEEAYKKAVATNDDETTKAMVKEYDSISGKLATINEQLEVNADKLRIAKERASKYARQLADVPQPEEEPSPSPGRKGETPERTSRAGSALEQRSKNFASQWKRVNSYLTNSLGRLRVFSALTAGIGKTLRRIAALAGGAFIFSAISRNFRSLRSSMEEMLRTNTNLMMALTRFKGVLKTAFLPIYEVAVPALTALLDLLTRIMGVVANFMAALTGKSTKEIKATAAALDQEAESTKGVGKAAKDANKPLASFDEINKLDSKDNGGGAGAGGAALADIEFPEIDLKSWGEMLDNFFNKLLGKLPALEDAFKKSSDKLNGFTKKLLEAFTFPGLIDKVKELGRGLAEEFKKLVDYIDWYTLGAALGAGLNLALGFLVEFIYGFDWIKLGRSLAECFKGLVSQVNWYDVGRLLWAGFKIALETLAGFITELDMPQLAQAASQIAIGFFNSITETFENIDWKQIGHQVAKFLENVDWDKVADACFTAIGAAFGVAAAFLWGLIEDAWDEVIQWWYNNAYEDGEFTMSGLLEGIWHKVKDIASWIKKHIFQPFIDGFKKAFGISSPAKELIPLGEYIMAGALKGIINMLRNITTWIKEHVFDPIFNAFKNAFGINNDKSAQMESAGEAISNGIANGIEGGLTAIKSVLNRIIEAVENAINWCVDKLNKLSFSAPSWVPNIGGKTFGVNLSHVTIPRLAQGAVIPPNREFLAVLGDQKSGNNIEAPEAALRQMAQEAAGVNTALLREILQAIREGKVIMVDKRELGRTARDAMRGLSISGY